MLPTITIVRHVMGVSIPLIYNKDALALSRLKKKVRNTTRTPEFFCTLTFSPGRKIISKTGKLYEYKYCLDDYIMTGEIMRNFFKKLRFYLKKRWSLNTQNWDFLWKYEEGKIDNRPHFHFFTWGLNKYMTGRVFRAIIQEIWNSGGTYVSRVYSHDMALAYMNKEFTKNTTLKHWKGKRRWSSSRGIKTKKHPNFMSLETILRDYIDPQTNRVRTIESQLAEIQFLNNHIGWEQIKAFNDTFRNPL